MARKPKIQPRRKAPRLPAQTKKRICQCVRCGALTDPIYGVGLNSWCPHCGQAGDICYDEGQIPDPELYGSWLKKHKEELALGRRADGTQPVISNPAPILLRSPQPGAHAMKNPTLHTGTYHCPECGIEFDLFQEESLKCDRCDGLLEKGSLDDAETDDDDDE